MKNKKKYSMAPKLGNVIDEILRLKKGEAWTQAKLGERIGVNQSMVSKMRYGVDWEQHWQVFLRLLEICEELDVFEEYYLRLQGEIRRRLSPHAQKQLDHLLSEVDPPTPPPSTEGAIKTRRRNV